MKTVNPETASHEELKAAYASLLKSRTDLKARNDALLNTQKNILAILGPMMPQMATLIEALAERAGLTHVPEIRESIRIVGDATYPHWAKDSYKFELPKMPASLEAQPNPMPGEAEMVLTARINNAIADLDHVALCSIKEPYSSLVSELIAAVEEGFKPALATISAQRRAEGAEANPVTSDTAEDAAPAGDPIEVIRDAAYGLMDALGDASFGMSILRTDLRAAMYRSLITRIAEQTRKIDAALQQLPQRASEDHPEAIPF